MEWAVLTGDIVESSDLSADALDAVMAALEQLCHSTTSWKTPIKSIFSRRGGDGWQIAIAAPKQALRMALLVQATARSHGAFTRIAVATGDGALPQTDKPDLNAAHGPVFQASGRLLEQLPARSHMAHAAGGAQRATFRLADHIAQGWTPAQARTLCLMLPAGSGPRRVAAQALGVSRQAVDQALHAAGYPALMDAITALEEAGDD